MNFRSLVAAAVLAVTATAAALPASAAPARKRHNNQMRLIRRGERKGLLTHGEARKLRRQENRISTRVHRSRASGGGMDWAERKRMNRAYSREHRRIMRLRRNNRHR